MMATIAAIAAVAVAVWAGGTALVAWWEDQRDRAARPTRRLTAYTQMTPVTTAATYPPPQHRTPPMNQPTTGPTSRPPARRPIEDIDRMIDETIDQLLAEIMAGTRKVTSWLDDTTAPVR